MHDYNTLYGKLKTSKVFCKFSKNLYKFLAIAVL